MFGLGPLEILVILVIALLVFGRRLPEIGRGVGKSIIEFKKGLAGMEDELHIDTNVHQNKNASQQTAKHIPDNTSPSMDASDTKQSASEKNPPSQS